MMYDYVHLRGKTQNEASELKEIIILICFNRQAKITNIKHYHSKSTLNLYEDCLSSLYSSFITTFLHVLPKVMK